MSVSRTAIADPGDGVDEELVADRVAECVVHGFELVQVHVQHAAHLAVSPGTSEGLVDAVGKHHPIRQSRQRIVRCLVGELRLDSLLVGEIASDARNRSARPPPPGSRSSPPSSGTVIHRGARLRSQCRCVAAQYARPTHTPRGSSLRWSCSSTGVRIVIGWPMISAAFQPNIASAAALNDWIVPCKSTV